MSPILGDAVKEESSSGSEFKLILALQDANISPDKGFLYPQTCTSWI
ncbi:hypothetical protein NOC27_1066 [Nitrosococcus oceani AFC27]|nr:hypothetical protein NOC27_1066 [Nitrosococcus oceani AFC27]